jgi:glycosyltransferase involved in cell wall biosynthesis
MWGRFLWNEQFSHRSAAQLVKISIITVCYNSATTITDTLCSVGDQSYDNIEHIVVDGGSCDGTIDLVSRHGRRVSKIVTEPDGGIYDAMNKGLRLATGEYVSYLNSDDYYSDKTVIQQVVKAIHETNADAIYGDLSYVKRNDPKKRVRYWKSQMFLPGSFVRGFAPPHPTFFMKRKLLDELGGFDLSYSLAADFDLMFRALEIKKCTSTYVPLELTRMRTGGATNISLKNIICQNQEILRCLRFHGASVSTHGFITRKLLSRIRQRYLKPTAS